MKHLLVAFGILLSFRTDLPAEPDLPSFGFSSSLPSVGAWEKVMEKDIKDGETSISFRGYRDANAEHTIVVNVGTNRPDEENDLDKFMAGWKKGATQKFSPPFVVTLEGKAAFGDVPARMFSGHGEISGVTSYISAYVALHAGNTYSLMIVTKKKEALEDEMIKAFLKSIKISAPSGR